MPLTPENRWVQAGITFAGSIGASLIVLSSALGTYRERIDRHDREIPELRGQLAATQNLVAAHTATLQGIDQKLDMVLSNQRAPDDRLNRALDSRPRPR